MSRRPKDIGTEGETASARFFQANGFPDARRIVLAGSKDEGDVTLGDRQGVTVEVKWGKTAEAASHGQVVQWMAETEVERINARNRHSLLIVKRKGVGKDRAGECWAFMPLRDVTQHAAGYDDAVEPGLPDFPVRMTLSEAAQLLRWAGFGDRTFNRKEPAA